jgi:hypothetical protein
VAGQVARVRTSLPHRARDLPRGERRSSGDPLVSDQDRQLLFRHHGILEAAIGRAIPSSNQVLLWNLLSLTRAYIQITDFGQLFAREMGKRPQDREALNREKTGRLHLLRRWPEQPAGIARVSEIHPTPGENGGTSADGHLADPTTSRCEMIVG